MAKIRPETRLRVAKRHRKPICWNFSCFDPPSFQMQTEVLAKAAAEARGLAIDAVHKAGIGHLGLPLGCAEIGAVLYGHALNIAPDQPRWWNRDRFVLSAGHGSMFLYAWLHLAGYRVSLDDVKAFRQLHSITPGHPEFGETEGVECTTGPLGQGVGNAVGLAVSQKMAAARYNTTHTIFDNRIVCLAGDGCLQEGVAREAVAFAGHFKLDNLILIYDANEVTLDAQAEETQSEDTAAIYTAMGWDVCEVDGHDMEAFLGAYEEARSELNGRPKLIIAKTVVGQGIPEVAGTWKAHGEGGAKFAESARKGLGLPEETFFVSEETRAYFAGRKKQCAAAYAEWAATYAEWARANPELAAELAAAEKGERPSAAEVLANIPEFPAGTKAATRASGGDVLQPLAKAYPRLVTGSADLFGSTKNYLKDGGDFTAANPKGRNFRFGIREHAMGAIVNGFGYDGIWMGSGATFLTFSDYMRPSIRLAALSKLPIAHIFTHDSVGVGEDGPTHQPVETVSALRLIPGLDVIRPADGEETAAAFAAALSRADGPTVLILSRQNLPSIDSVPAKERREGTLRGAYIARKESAALDTILLATGSELAVAMAAAEKIGPGCRVVSVPSMEIFERQSAEYKETILPPACRRRIAVEAGVTGLWHRYTGLDGAVVGIDRFGLSAPGNVVMEHLGIHTAAVVDAATSLSHG
ncbi:MAG: transketolase [Opitutales bacterium]|nr:transketolase [Opitutales bacterium]